MAISTIVTTTTAFTSVAAAAATTSVSGLTGVAIAASRKLDCEAHVFEGYSVKSWNDVTRVHGILVFDEAEAVHELDLEDLAAMCAEELFDFGFGDIFWQVAEVEPCVGNFGPRGGGNRSCGWGRHCWV